MTITSMKPGHVAPNGNVYPEEVIARMREQINHYAMTHRPIPVINNNMETGEINPQNVVGEVKHARRADDGALLLDIEMHSMTPFTDPDPDTHRLSSCAYGYTVDNAGIEPEYNVTNESVQRGARIVSDDEFQIIAFSIQPK